MIAFGNVLAEWLVLSFAERSALANEKYAQLDQKDFAFFALNIVSFVKNISAIRV